MFVRQVFVIQVNFLDFDEYKKSFFQVVVPHSYLIFGIVTNTISTMSERTIFENVGNW